MLFKPKATGSAIIFFIVIIYFVSVSIISYGSKSGNQLINNPLISISGTVKYTDSLIVTQGYVKALILDTSSYSIIVVDSTGIQFNGTYLMQITPPPPQIYIVAYPSSEEDFIPTYYPNKIDWQQAIKVTLDSNHSNINIFTSRIPVSSSNGVIYGYVNGNQASQITLKDAVIYAKTGTFYRGFSISTQSGYYRITKLPQGNYILYTDRMGYNGQTINISFNSDSLNVDFSLIKTPIGIKEIHGRTPVNFSLKQNYPNPFNPSTKIKFDLPISGNVSLTVYDITGRVVEILFNQELKAGRYEAEFNALNYPSGIYFYKMEASGFFSTKKMIILK